MSAADTAARALTRLQLDGALRTVDMAFARLLRERLGADAAVALAGALAMRAVALGDSGFAIARADALLDALDARATLPEAEAWREALRASPWVSAAPSPGDRVLLCFAHDRVALRRYAQYEQMLAARLHLRLRGDAEQPLPPPRPQSLALLRALFSLGDEGGAAVGVPETVGVPDSTLDRQALAAWLALRRRLALITGGPGTGKTTTVARLLALLVAEAAASGAASPRIALAAPTGRAAVRLGEAIAAQLARDVADGRLAPSLAEAVPARARTVHRLLGARRHSVGFRHHAGRPLPADVVVVDEASMIDLPLMTRLLDAVPVDARLILLGDPDQLPAVEAGDVLGALCAAAGDGLALPPPLAAEASQVLDAAVPATQPMPTAAADTPIGAQTTTGHAALPGTRVHLLRGWRQAGAAGLQALAAAVQAGDADALFAALEAGHADLHWRPGGSGLADWLRAVALPSFEAVRDAADPAEALQRARALRLLTALRRGPAGAEHWNAWCAAELGARTQDFHGALFHGALIAISANSPRHGLSNGDLGVAWADADGSLAVHVDLGGRWGAWRPAQLPPHALAFASTVHKAQGAEFARVALVLPGAGGPGQPQLPRALSRELLYTAITRARSGLLLWASAEALRVAIGRRSHRDSGLGLALAQPD